MSGKIVWKFALTAIVVAWAVLNLIPLRDTPFEEFVRERATAKQSEFAQVLKEADARVAAKQAPSVFVALRKIATEKKLNLAQFFPDIPLTDIPNQDRRNEVLLRELLRESQGKLKLGLDLKGGMAFTLKVDPQSVKTPDQHIRAQQLEKAIEIMDRRLNGLGVAEPIIRAAGPDSIEIQMPGVTTRDNPEAIDVLKKPAKLEFRLVHRTLDPRTTPETDYPIGYEVLTETIEDKKTGSIQEIPMFVKRIPEAGGDIIEAAFPSIDQMGAYKVNMKFTSTGSDDFANLTRRIAEENQRTGTPGRMAIVLDGKLYSAPSVREEIRGGSAEITGRFSQREVFELSNVLNNPLQVELVLDQMYEVGSSLAEDARDASIKAAVVGSGLVILFMIGYYLVAGLVAVVTVVTIMAIVIGLLASVGATITLPGVAALVLTVGMAVDANILIYERMREEMKLGKSLAQSLAAGFERALSTIVDANLTTLITAGVLIWLGTGPVKGFGVTLAIGIMATVFCALVLSRGLLEFLVERGWVKTLKFMSLVGETSFDFFKYRKPAFIASWALVVIGLSAAFIKGDRILGIDFLGGDQMTAHFTQRLTIKQIEEVAQKSGIGEVYPVYQKVIGDTKDRLSVQTPVGKGEKLFDALLKAYPNAGLELDSINTIGATFSEGLTRNAIISVAVALVGILIYVAFRFEVGYGVAAVLATAHDALMTIGLFVLVGGQFSAPMVAAILMVIGYSINDTIVVFDRIREELKLNPELNLIQVINLSVNRTLSRTTLTGLTTLLSAVALWIWGAGVIQDYALIFIFGVLTGTFSSIFIAAPMFFWWHRGDRRHVEEREWLPKYSWDSSTKVGR